MRWPSWAWWRRAWAMLAMPALRNASMARVSDGGEVGGHVAGAGFLDVLAEGDVADMLAVLAHSPSTFRAALIRHHASSSGNGRSRCSPSSALPDSWDWSAATHSWPWSAVNSGGASQMKSASWSCPAAAAVSRCRRLCRSAARGRGRTGWSTCRWSRRPCSSQGRAPSGRQPGSAAGCRPNSRPSVPVPVIGGTSF
jgi:hypothetical protein